MSTFDYHALEEAEGGQQRLAGLKRTLVLAAGLASLCLSGLLSASSPSSSFRSTVRSFSHLLSSHEPPKATRAFWPSTGLKNVLVRPAPPGPFQLSPPLFSEPPPPNVSSLFFYPRQMQDPRQLKQQHAQSIHTQQSYGGRGSASCRRLEAVAKLWEGAQVMPAVLYGARLEISGGTEQLGVATGLSDDVLEGHLLNYPPRLIAAKLEIARSLWGGLVTAVVHVVVEDGSSRLAYWLHQPELSPYEDVLPPEAAKILSFWLFGSWQTLYRELWFPDDKSGRQAAADETVKTRFGKLLTQAMQRELHTWMNKPLPCLALVLLLDQCSRHIFRGLGEEQKASLQHQANELALTLAEHIQAKRWGERYTVPERMFSLMPFRHSPTEERLRLVLDEISAMQSRPATYPSRCSACTSAMPPEGPWRRFCSQCGLQQEPEFSSLLAKFHKATLKRYQKLTDQAPEGSEILEHFPFVVTDPDKLAALDQDKLVATTRAFLLQHQPANSSYVALSLSGGVDSMVLARILVHLAHTSHANLSIVAAHIDYRNRLESQREAEFLRAWCAEQNILLRIRAITEIQRASARREEYESITRNIRFGTYKQLLQDFGCPAVMFGHHQSDLQENVISNVMKGSTILNLGGMSVVSTLNGVVVWRPLLAHRKDDIYKFAHKYGVPYFKDTTSSWGTRGQLRNQLLPLLQDMYGEGVLSKLTSIAAQSEQLEDLTSKNLFEPFYDTVRTSALGVWMEATKYTDRNLFFWKQGLRHVLHAVGFNQVSERALPSLLERLRQAQPSKTRPRDRQGYWLPLKADTPSLLLDGKLIFLLSAAKPRLSQLPFKPGTKLLLESIWGEPLQLGCWTVELTFAKSGAGGPAGGAKQPDTESLVTTWDVLTGGFSYALKVPSHGMLVIDPSGQRTPLRAVDKDLRATIPMIQVDAPRSSSNANTNTSSASSAAHLSVRVHYNFTPPYTFPPFPRSFPLVEPGKYVVEAEEE